MKHPIAKFLIYSDGEIAILPNSIIEFIRMQQHLKPIEAFEIGVCAVEFQYNIRLLKHRTANLPMTEYEVRTNNKFIKTFEKFPDLIDFMIESYQQDYINDPQYYYELTHQKKFSMPSVALKEVDKQQIYESIDRLDLNQYLN